VLSPDEMCCEMLVCTSSITTFTAAAATIRMRVPAGKSECLEFPALGLL